MLPSFGNKTAEERMVSQDITKYWDSIQSTIKCCGYSDINDWENTSFYNNTNNHYPPSCCSETNTFDGGFTTQLVMNQSCTFEKVQNFTGGVSCEGVAKSNFMVLSGVALGVLGIEFLAMFASCCMYRSLEEDYWVGGRGWLIMKLTWNWVLPLFTVNSILARQILTLNSTSNSTTNSTPNSTQFEKH